MLALTVLVTFCETKVNDKDLVTVKLSAADQEVIRLDIAMDNSLFMDLLKVAHKLYSNLKHSLEIEFLPALLEEIL